MNQKVTTDNVMKLRVCCTLGNLSDVLGPKVCEKWFDKEEYGGKAST